VRRARKAGIEHNKSPSCSALSMAIFCGLKPPNLSTFMNGLLPFAFSGMPLLLEHGSLLLFVLKGQVELLLAKRDD
jgi:hypothetical protein